VEKSWRGEEQSGRGWANGAKKREQKMKNKIHYFKCEKSIRPKLGRLLHHWGHRD
jgi:hypothetical protein